MAPPKILPCPHYTLPMTGDHTTRYITLIDTPDEYVAFAVCGVCQNILKGYFITDIAAELMKNYYFVQMPPISIPPIAYDDGTNYTIKYVEPDT